MRQFQKTLPIVFSLLCPTLAYAYVGPGAGIGLIGALGGLIVAILLAVGVILIWPLRMLLRKRKARAAALAGEAGGTETNAINSAD
jgi:hypothetical protein